MMDENESNKNAPVDKDMSNRMPVYVNIQYFIFKFLE